MQAEGRGGGGDADEIRRGPAGFRELRADPVLGLLAAEMLRDEVGQDAVLDRLLDLLLIDAVRTHFARTEHTAPGWYRAHRDPVVAQAVRLRHPACILMSRGEDRT